MKLKIKALLILTLVSGICAEPLQLTSAKVGDSSTLEGSLRGGTALTIHGIGFDVNNPTLYNVFVGPFECTIPAEGVQATTLTCETTDTGLTSDSKNHEI